jgi:hypothetical protein
MRIRGLMRRLGICSKLVVCGKAAGAKKINKVLKIKRRAG